MPLFQRIAYGAAVIRASFMGQSLPPIDDYWWQPRGSDSSAGMAVSPETAMRLSVVYSCVRVRSETLAACPLEIFQRFSDGREERATDHPLYQVLHNSPNQWQTSFEFIELMQTHLDLRGNAFARILPGPRGAIDQLIPIHPDLVNVYRLPNGRLKYQVRSRFTAEIDWFTQDEMFHLRGQSQDGLVGLSPIALQRETIGNALGMQDYFGRFLRNDAQPRGYLTGPGTLFRDDAARAEYKNSWQKSQTGENRHTTAVLDRGMEYKTIAMSNKDAQFLEAIKASREEICGMYLVPPHKVAILERSTNNNIEHQGIEFVTGCMQLIANRWERRIAVDMIDPLTEVVGDGQGEYFAKFLLDGLLRGAFKDRMDGYAIAKINGFLNTNGVCRFENWNPVSHEDGGDDYWRPLNMLVNGQEPPEPAPGQIGTEDTPATPGKPDTENDLDNPPDDNPDDEGADDPKARALHARLKVFALDAAGRMVRRETAALRKLNTRFAEDPAAFLSSAEYFYQEHAHTVSRALNISPTAAMQYAAVNLRSLALQSSGERAAVLDWIEDTAPEQLATMALGKKRRQRRELSQ